MVSNGSSTSFTATGRLLRSPLITSLWFPVNSICTGGPLCYTTNYFWTAATTIAGLTTLCSNTVARQPGIWHSSQHTGFIQCLHCWWYLVVRSTAASLGSNPVNGTVYLSGDALGGGIVLGKRGAALRFTTNSLAPNTTVLFLCFCAQLCSLYQWPAIIPSQPAGQLTKLQPFASLRSTISTTHHADTFIHQYSRFRNLYRGGKCRWLPGDEVLLPALYRSTADNTDYNVGGCFRRRYCSCQQQQYQFCCNRTYTRHTYYFFVLLPIKFALAAQNICNRCMPLSGNIATTNTAVNNYYFGTCLPLIIQMVIP